MVSDETLDDFIQGLVSLNAHIKQADPEVVIYPIRGAVPIADLLHIIDPSIATRHEEYMPASSSITNTNDVIYEWFLNFLKEEHVPGQRQKIVTIDEVISGNSVVRVQKQMLRAMRQYGRANGIEAEAEIEKSSLALQVPNPGKLMQRTYLKLVEQGVVVPIQVKENIVMDKPELCPVKLTRIPGDQYGMHLPTMQEFAMGKEYLNLLARVASARGVDISGVSLQNPAKIRASERFLPDRYRSVESYLVSRK